MDKQSDVLVEVQQVVKHFPVKGGILLHEADSVKAVNDVSFQIRRGETFGLVGESGCGKSTLGNILLGLERPTGGTVLYNGTDLYHCGRSTYKQLRQEIQVVFQDPYESLNPRMTVGELVSEGLNIRGGMSKEEKKRRVLEILEQVGLNPEHYSRYPHEFSGGQRQRIGIARALIVEPKFIICDEPVSALDVSVQAQIINLLSDLQKKYDMTYLFIAHGLNVVKHVSDRVGVMYLGKMMEIAPKQSLYNDPLSPYTQALLSAIPSVDPNDKRDRIILEGDVPSPIDPPPGCRFSSRCFAKVEGCDETVPPLREVKPNHWCACHRYDACKKAPAAATD